MCVVKRDASVVAATITVSIVIHILFKNLNKRITYAFRIKYTQQRSVFNYCDVVPF